MERPGFSQAEKSNMLLSEETLYGLKMTRKIYHLCIHCFGI